MTDIQWIRLITYLVAIGFALVSYASFIGGSMWQSVQWPMSLMPVLFLHAIWIEGHYDQVPTVLFSGTSIGINLAIIFLLATNSSIPNLRANEFEAIFLCMM